MSILLTLSIVAILAVLAFAFSQFWQTANPKPNAKNNWRRRKEKDSSSWSENFPGQGTDGISGGAD